LTVFEYAIAREANRLGEESKKRDLTDKERRLFYLLRPSLQRLENEEALRNYARGNRGTADPLSSGAD
jgi:hypothetical protein